MQALPRHRIGPALGRQLLAAIPQPAVRLRNARQSRPGFHVLDVRRAPPVRLILRSHGQHALHPTLHDDDDGMRVGKRLPLPRALLPHLLSLSVPQMLIGCAPSARCARPRRPPVARTPQVGRSTPVVPDRSLRSVATPVHPRSARILSYHRNHRQRHRFTNELTRGD